MVGKSTTPQSEGPWAFRRMFSLRRERSNGSRTRHPEVALGGLHHEIAVAHRPRRTMVMDVRACPDDGERVAARTW